MKNFFFFYAAGSTPFFCGGVYRRKNVKRQGCAPYGTGNETIVMGRESFHGDCLLSAKYMLRNGLSVFHILDNTNP